jgi:hypothetical protein
MVNNEQKDMGTRKFRIKRVPNPEPSLHSITGKTVTRSQLSIVQGVEAKMPIDFDFDLKWRVTSFNLEIVQPGNNLKSASSSSNKFTEEQRALIMEAKIGTRLYITDIKAKADGIDDIRELPNINYQVNG